MPLNRFLIVMLLPLAVLPVRPLDAQAVVDLQGYPAGAILTGALLLDLGDWDVEFGAGYNVTDRRDFGRHDDEKGGGFGIRATLWRQLNSRFEVAVRSDVWYLDIDWEDQSPPAMGTTQVLVWQPTLVSALVLPVSRCLSLRTSLAVGAEVNLNTDGEPVGEGAIVLAGVGMRIVF